MPLTARDLLKGHFCIVPIQSGGIAGDLPVVVLQVEMCWITKLIGISNLFDTCWDPPCIAATTCVDCTSQACGRRSRPRNGS